MKKLWYYLCSLSFVLLTLAACSGSNPSATTPQKTTVLIYIEGTNLESGDGYATDNIKEMLAAKSAPHLTVVLATGAADKAVATDPVRSWRSVKRHLIKDGQITELQDLGGVDMGSTAVLTDFITWGQNSYPADKFHLVFWDHGGGALYGYGGDKPTGTSRLSISQISQAISDAIATTGKSFEMIGFDACLMATAEIAANLAPYARYLTAAEETEPGPGWNYTPYLNAIAANPAADGLTAGKAIADSFAAKAGAETDNYTLSVLDLSKLHLVMTALQKFSVLAASQMAIPGGTAWTALANARNATDEYAADYVNQRFYNLVDIGHYAVLLGAGDITWRQVAAEMRAAVSQAVSYNVAGARHSAATGLSLYFPFHDFKEALQSQPKYAAVPFVDQYRSMISSFVQNPLDHPPRATLQISAPTATGQTMQAIAASPYGLAEQYVVMAQPGAGEAYTMLGMDIASSSSSGNDQYSLSYTRDSLWYTLEGRHVMVFFENKDNSGLYNLEIPVLYRTKGSDISSDRPVNLGVRYNPANNSGTVRAAWEGMQTDGIASRQNVDVNPGDIMTPIFMTFDPANIANMVSYTYGAPYTLNSDTLLFNRTQTPPGGYNLFFMIRDLAGNEVASTPTAIAGVPAGKLAQMAAPAKPPANVLLQGFWNNWTKK